MGPLIRRAINVLGRRSCHDEGFIFNKCCFSPDNCQNFSQTRYIVLFDCLLKKETFAYFEKMEKLLVVVIMVEVQYDDFKKSILFLYIFRKYHHLIKGATTRTQSRPDLVRKSSSLDDYIQ